MRARRLLLAPVLLVLAPGTAAGAVETEGRGANITHVKNLPYPELFDDEPGRNQGTDVEFAVITVAGPDAAPPAASPLAATPPATTPPAIQPAEAPAPPKATKKPKKKAKPCRRGKSRKARARHRRCVQERRKARARDRAKARPRARRSVGDARASQPGVQREFAFAGSYSDGLQIVDITDPENARIVATWNCGVAQGDVQVFQREDLGGRWFVAFTQDSGYSGSKESQCYKDLGITDDGPGTFFADVTDPYNPRTVSHVKIPQGSHNGTVHPSGRYFYNSNSDLITSPLPAIEIVDISDVAAPKVVGEVALKTLPGLGTEAHDITFSPDGSRAYVAALSHGEILDTTNPADPRPVGTVVDPTINVWHQTDPLKVGDRTFLIAEDEAAGAIGTGQCPNGGVHVFDVTDEAQPMKVGYWNITDVGPTEDNKGTRLGRCTAHVFQLHPDQQLMTIAYYNGGVRVVDLSGLEGIALGGSGAGMKQLGWFRFPDGDAWSFKAPRVDRNGFYAYANDKRRGLDVYRFAPGAAATGAGDVWLSAEQARAAATRLRAVDGGLRIGGVCILPSSGQS